MKRFDKIKSQIKPIKIKNNVSRLSVFGSFAMGQQNKNSDIDVLVKFNKEKSLIDFIGLKLELEKEFKRDVDLLTYEAINPLLKESIQKDEIVIYG